MYYQYKADRARRTLRGIDEQVAKAAKAVAGLAPVKRTSSNAAGSLLAAAAGAYGTSVE